MKQYTLPKPAPAAPVQAPPVAPAPLFTPSAELADQLESLAQAQAEIDRKKPEELARLRALQDRD